MHRHLLKFLIFPIVSTIVFTMVCTTAALGVNDNPSPLHGDFILPLPGQRNMAFRPVFMGQGDTPFAQKSFRMGDPDGGFKEHPTEVSLGGSFTGDTKSGRDWLFYLGKYEVTQAQWAAVMALPAPDPNAGAKPVTGISWFEAQDFLNKLNQWLFANALDKLPRSGSSPGFLRLPTEAEWEFAARGGAAVSADVFDRRVPYTDTLNKYEWFEGPKSSHGKLKSAGLLAPNPIGLHDMLGNVTEMTQGLYMIEYYQGRPGGFVARGGHFLSSEKTLRSSLRTEEPFYMARGSEVPKPNRKATMGFRPVLAAVVFVDRNAAKSYADAWDTYRAGAGADTPAAVSTAPTIQKTKAGTNQAGEYLDRLEKIAAGHPDMKEDMKQDLNRLRSVIEDIQFIQAKADAETAYAWFKIAAERGFFIHLESQKLPTVHKLIDAAKAGNRTAMVEKLEIRCAEIEANISQAMENYTASLRQMDTLSLASRHTARERYLKFLLENDAAEQIRAAKLVANHLAELSRTKRTTLDEWKKQLSTLGI
ncbi:formylglycine-generating enzyme family protein [Desulfobacter vibrioformis]|uniref:formylglycine-generating enzyme family protein n=1 Tax=Desulfobacter vibrioformis TaxID=34031 RepID=UPI001FE22CF8|nr:SUMF1/EgtB/PvdO family nonheme iron enzyme [Desulfobacter vibrioformis]